ncbi:MAG: hypothetical protein HC914_19180, partial [Chloroflexaceae bacterium]|nr:hypothetical protein [Chloroflexaceae bacterium]
MDISLYRMIPQNVRDSVFVNSVPLMNVISHEIEDVVMNNGLKVDFYAGFQHFSRFARQVKRYTRLANVCRRVYVWGIADVTPPAIPGVEYLPLTEDMSLAREWFVVVDSPTFFTSLMTQEQTWGVDVPPGQRRFEGIWTYDSDIVSRAHLLISQLLGHFYEGVVERDYECQSKHLVQISNRLVRRQDQQASREVLSQHHSSLLRAGLSHIEVPMLILDHNQYVIAVTQAASALLHTAAEHMTGQPFHECANGMFANVQLSSTGATPPVPLGEGNGSALLASVSNILDAGQHPMGWVVTLHAEGSVAGMRYASGSAALPATSTLQRYLGSLQQLITMLPSVNARPDVQQRVVTQMQRLVGEANTLVKRLALLQSIETQPVSEVAPFAMRDLVQEVINEWRVEAVSYQVELSIEPVGNPLMVQGNADLLRMAVRELLNNVQQHAHGTMVAATLVQQNGQVTLTVRDDGMGIDQGDLMLLFDRRAPATGAER